MAKGAKTGGRKAGTANKSTTGIKELASKYSHFCVEQLVNIAKKSKVESNKLAAIEQLLNRAHGKPTQAMGVDPDMPTGKITVSWEK